MTYLELAKQLRQETGTAGIGPTSVNGQSGEYKRLVDWINKAYLAIQVKWLDWGFLWKEGTLPLVADQATYLLPADLGLLDDKTLRIGMQKLELVEFSEYREQRDLFDGQPPAPVPTEFTLRPDGKLLLLPTPSAAGTLQFDYFRTGHQLVNNDDQPLIPVRFHDTIVWRAKMFWAEFEDAQAEYRLALANFQDAILRLEASELPNYRKAHGRASGTDIVIRAV